MNDMSRRMSLPPEPEAPARGRLPRSGLFGVLDIGSSKIVCLIGRVESDGAPRVVGFGWQKARGVRSGNITDLEEAERAIRAAVGQAEEMADTRLAAVTVNLAAGAPESRLFNVQWPVGGRAVGEDDIRRVIREGVVRAAGEGRDIVHALPLVFSVDETAGVFDPRGMHCEILTARLHVIDAVSTALRNLAVCLGRCELDIADLVSAPFAAALAALVADERELGATLIDMGAGTSGIAVFAEGQLLHTAMLPVGGSHVTNDIARLLSTTVAHAERLKTLFGTVQESPDDHGEMLAVPLVGEGEQHIAKVPRSMVVSIIRPRLEETFELAKERLEASGLARAGGSRMVLTGGACQLIGVREMAARTFGRQVRLGRPFGLKGLPDAATGPGFATAAGLLAWAGGQGRSLPDVALARAPAGGLFNRILRFIRERL